MGWSFGVPEFYLDMSRPTSGEQNLVIIYISVGWSFGVPE